MKLQDYINKHGNVEIEEKALNELLGISKVWKPKVNEYCYYVGADGEIAPVVWENDFDGAWEMGNVYQTKEQAEFAVEKRKVEVELQRFALEHNEGEIDWNNHKQFKYCIYFDYETKEISIWHYSKHKYGDVYFTSVNIAKQAIQAIGEERLKKYYFGVED